MLSRAIATTLCSALCMGSTAAFACPNSSDGSSSSARASATLTAAKKRCKKGQHLVTVHRNGKRVKVCKKKHTQQQQQQQQQG
jgi:hypothetical protein